MLHKIVFIILFYYLLCNLVVHSSTDLIFFQHQLLPFTCMVKANMEDYSNTLARFIIKFVLWPLCLSFSTGSCYLFVRKFRYSFEPIHVFLANFLGLISAIMLTWQIVIIMKYFEAPRDFCFEYFVLLCLNLAISLGVICMQVDLVVALCWPLLYPGIISTGSAVTACSVSAVLAILLSILISTVIDRDYTQCVHPTFLIYTRQTNILFEGLPKLLAVAMTTIVAILSWIIQFMLNKTSIPPMQ